MSDPTGDPPPPRVIAVEDNPADVRLVTEGIDHAGTEVDLRVINSGQRAINRFTTIDADAPLEHPELILLDLNLPVRSGFAVLNSIRNQTTFQDVPVVVVSGSMDRTDITRVYERSGNAYVTKPADPDDYIETISAIVEFWIPPGGRLIPND
ncbi:MAG: HoxA-like transcriptional regulator [uncultured archaeon A07HR67]|jgi:Response regulators consisting of a CheY-like receiver domain and a winged-helix DNA-binding domain|nr:MAG: HoxA-like transcriptional regulator [uncultured archaeon A07HR67]